MHKSAHVLVVFVVTFFNLGAVHAISPVLNFSDIVSGPAQGLDDGQGEGAIVTIWGQNLGSAQETSKVIFTDAEGRDLSPAYVYYWKNADGALPGGPADLYGSHKMQEIAFSLPTAVVGAGSIQVTVGGEASNKLPFTVSSTGKIYWVSESGSNSNSGSYTDPWEYINADIGGSSKGAGDGKLSAGDIVYSLGVEEPELTSGGRNVGLFIRDTVGTSANPISFIAYPNTRPTVITEDQGMVPYHSDYLNLSKFYISVGHTDPSLDPDPGVSNQSDYHIKVDKGRYVGNYLGQNSGTCITGWSGAITSGGGNAEGVKIFGNEVDGLGCSNTSRFQHTIYISIRDGDSSLSEAWDFSYNYLHDNFPMFGIHFYDEQYNGDCGTLDGTIVVSNNVVVNQWGPAINIKTADKDGAKNVCWSADILIENNVLRNVGLGEALDDNVTPKPSAIRIGGDIAPDKITIRNNTIFEWGGASAIAASGFSACMEIGHHSSVNPVISVQNNVCKSNDDFPYVITSKTIDSSEKNLFYTSASSSKNATVPDWTNNVVADPNISFLGNVATVASGSSVVNNGYRVADSIYDVYGHSRGTIDIGAVEFVGAIEEVIFADPKAPGSFIRVTK